MINHVSTFEQGQRLKELGWNKPTKFMWLEDAFGADVIERDRAEKIKSMFPDVKIYPALLADEALGELPEKIDCDGHTYMLTVWRYCDEYSVSYWSDGVEDFLFGDVISNKEKLPIAATDMLIWALENNYVKGHRGKAA